MAEFKDRLKLLRKEKGLKQHELAELLGRTVRQVQQYEKGLSFPPTDSLSRVSIGNYERGDREPVYSTVIGLAKFFDVSTDYLLGLSDDRKPTVIEKSLDLTKVPTDDLMREVVRRWSPG